MSEKHLTELPWKTLAVKQQIKDTGLQKALFAYGKLDPAKNADAVLKCLDEIGGQALKLKKATAANKEVAAYLDEVIKECAKTEKTVTLMRKSQAEAAAKEAEDEQSSDLKPRLINSLKKVKAAQGAESLAFVACAAKPCYGVLLAKSATELIGPTHKKVLTDLTGATKFIIGKCLLEKVGEKETYTFVVDPVPSGLARRLTAALKEFTGLKYPVRVRDTEGKVVADGDTDTGEAEIDAVESISAKAIPATPPTPASAQKAPPVAQAKPAAAPAAPPPPPVNKELDATLAEIEAVQKLVDELRKHPHMAQVGATFITMDGFLTNAREQAKFGNYKHARETAAAAKKEYEAAKKIADQYGDYTKKRAEASALIHSWRGYYTDASSDDAKAFEKTLDDLDAKLTAADALASSTKRDFTKANAAVAAVQKQLAERFKSFYVESVEPEIKKLKAKKAVSFVADDLKEIESLHAEVISDLAKNAWRKVLLSGARVDELISIALKLADRREKFDKQRVITRKAVDSLKKQALFATQVAEQEKLLADADTMASRKNMRLEDAVDELKKITTTCTNLLAGAKDATAYDTERKAADKKLAALSTHPAAASLKDALPGIQQQLERADAHAKSLEWKAARAVLAQVTAALASAGKLADNAKDLQAAVSGKSDAAAVKKVVAKLRTQAATIAKSKDAGLLKADLKKVEDSLAEAEAQAAAKPPGDATGPLKAAADLLVTLAGTQSQHDRFVKLRKTIEDRQKALLKLPTATANKTKIDAIGQALAEADAHDQAHDWTKLTEAIGAAQEAATEAEKMAGLRKDFDARAKKLADHLKDEVKAKRVDATQAQDIQVDLTSADKEAADFKFDYAKRALDHAENEFEGIVMGKLAGKTPPNTNLIVASAKKMIAKGGASQIDSLVKDLPDTVPYTVLKTLAKERFGVTLSDDGSDDGTDPASATKSAKELWAMMAKVPDDVVGNPSLKQVKRELPDDNGGLYRSSDEAIVMNGRPNQSTQDFGANIADEVPADVDENCKPVNEDAVDYFDFATLHEVGHSVDDNLHFMESKTLDAEFGGWQSHGGKVEPIAEQVAKWAGYDDTPEQRQYIVDLILGNEPADLVPSDANKAVWDAGLAKVKDWYALATWDHIWWNHTKSKSIMMKDNRIYHQAYPRVWVSYLAAARQKAITGYQFRAPGEWFAELYASYRIGKLKDDHPSVKWLKAIDI